MYSSALSSSAVLRIKAVLLSPSIQLSDFFGVSVDYIVGKDRIEPSTLSEYEISLIRASRSTSPSVQEDVLDFLNMKKNKE